MIMPNLMHVAAPTQIFKVSLTDTSKKALRGSRRTERNDGEDVKSDEER
jgi:hypothetical protein